MTRLASFLFPSPALVRLEDIVDVLLKCLEYIFVTTLAYHRGGVGGSATRVFFVLCLGFGSFGLIGLGVGRRSCLR
jgi:hypothetical protein